MRRGCFQVKTVKWNELSVLLSGTYYGEPERRFVAIAYAHIATVQFMVGGDAVYVTSGKDEFHFVHKQPSLANDFSVELIRRMDFT